MLLELVSRDEAVSAGIDSLAQYSETFRSSYDVYFKEALATDNLRHPVLRGLTQSAVKSRIHAASAL